MIKLEIETRHEKINVDFAIGFIRPVSSVSFSVYSTHSVCSLPFLPGYLPEKEMHSAECKDKPTDLRDLSVKTGTGSA